MKKPPLEVKAKRVVDAAAEQRPGPVDDDRPEDGQDTRKDQREEARAHPHGIADLVRKRPDGEGQAETQAEAAAGDRVDCPKRWRWSTKTRR